MSEFSHVLRKLSDIYTRGIDIKYAHISEIQDVPNPLQLIIHQQKREGFDTYL